MPVLFFSVRLVGTRVFFKNNRIVRVIFRSEPARLTLGVGAPILITPCYSYNSIEKERGLSEYCRSRVRGILSGELEIPQKNVGIPAAWLL